MSAISHKDVFLILHIPYFAAVGALYSRICVEGMCSHIVEAYGEGEWQFATGVYCSGEHIGDGIAGFAAQIPCLHYCRHFLYPWHCYGVARDVHHHQVLVDCCEGFDYRILRIWQFQSFAVGVFTVLIVAFVESADKNHIVSIS